jgi:hypothetical protein
MASILRKPVVIAAIVAVLSIATLLLINHTTLIVDLRPPPTPPGTTFHAVKYASANAAPTLPETAIKPTPPGPKSVQPAIPAK